MPELKLYMVLLGCKPKGRFTEQHDIFFGIGKNLAELKPAIRTYWKEAPKIHIDAWREVNIVDGYRIEVSETITPEAEPVRAYTEQQLFFINLGGYKRDEFDEFHYKMLIVAPDLSVAIKMSKESGFYKHTGFEGAVSHIDDKYGIDVDDVYHVEDILNTQYKNQFRLSITKADRLMNDEFHLGYLKWDRIAE